MIYDKSQLTELFKNGCKTRENFKIGLEFEKLAVDSKNHKAVPYYGKKGICDFLSRYKAFKQMDEVLSDGNLIGLKDKSHYISLEPGSQTEISAHPCKKISEIASKIKEYNEKTAIIGSEFGFNWIGYGIQPVSTFDNIKIIPKKRYEIMTDYLPTKGNKALVMMRETAGIQTSVDYESEEDAINKLKVSLAVSPIITAMFANSPVRNGKETGYQSYRASSWLKTDNDRCGLISRKIFEGKRMSSKPPAKQSPASAFSLPLRDFSFDDYAQYLLDTPMFFIERDNIIINATHLTFKAFLDNGLDGFKANIADWELHTSTVFPDVRLRNYIEIRNCDSQRSDMILALPALMKGIMYDKNALNQAWSLVKDFSWSELEEMRHFVPKLGLKTIVKGKRVADLAKELVNIAEISLLSNHETRDEVIYLEKIKELVEQEKTPADIILQNWNSGWNQNIEKLIEYSKLS